jgi:tRNA uridine 5-carboxymethylaminomethyl modification enzyme
VEKELHGKTVILTTGTYLSSNILIGKEKTTGGPHGEPTTFGISKQLKELGLDVVRLKTGTPPRVARNSIDYSKMLAQPGDNEGQTFSLDGRYFEENPHELLLSDTHIPRNTSHYYYEFR